MQTPDLVAWRLRHGSACAVCPLKGQRFVGADGPADAAHIVIGDVPSADEAQYGVARGVPHGRAFSDRASYWWKLEFLVTNGLAERVRRETSKWPYVRLTGVQVMNVAMCADPDAPGNDPANTPNARAARRCCANSLRAWLRRRLKENPNISLHPQGAEALADLRREKSGIDAYRGRFLGPVRDTVGEWESGAWQAHVDALLADEPEETIIKAVLRGRKPTETWWPAFEAWMKGHITWAKKQERKREAFTKVGGGLTKWGRLYDRQAAKAEKAKAKRKGAADAESASVGGGDGGGSGGDDRRRTRGGAQRSAPKRVAEAPGAGDRGLFDGIGFGGASNDEKRSDGKSVGRDAA